LETATRHNKPIGSFNEPGGFPASKGARCKKAKGKKKAKRTQKIALNSTKEKGQKRMTN